MLKRILFVLITASVLAGCGSSTPERIETDEKLPTSPCACGPAVKPLMWETA
jgi:hypothetical protein